MESMIVIGMFVVTALSLNCIVSGKPKTAGGLNVINLCLIVATAFQFKLMKNIFYILLFIAIACVVFIFVRYRMINKKDHRIGHDH